MKNEARNARIVADYLAAKMSAHQIGKKHGLTGSRVCQIVKDGGVWRPKVLTQEGRRGIVAAGRRRSSNHKPPKENAEAVAFVASGMSFREAGEKLGISRNKVAGAVWRAQQKAERLGRAR